AGADADLVGVGRYEPTNEADTVEVAFVVQDSWQNRGLGTILFDAILQAAAARSFRRFRAYVLADNKRMLDLVSRFTRVESRQTARGVIGLVFRPDPEKAPAATWCREAGTGPRPPPWPGRAPRTWSPTDRARSATPQSGRWDHTAFGPRPRAPG